MAGPEELFLKPDHSPTVSTTETPKPLRINKQPSSSPSSASSNEQQPPRQQWAQYKVPPSAASAAYGAPTSPPPTGPLPYPDERTQQRRPERGGPPAQEFGEVGTGFGPAGSGAPRADARRRSMASDASSGAGSGHSSRRARFDAADPQRPTAGGYGHSPPQLAGRLAERRGTPVKGIVPPDSPGGPEPPHKSPEHTHRQDSSNSEDADDEEGTLFAIPPVGARKVSEPKPAPEPDRYQQYYPPPLGSTAPATSSIPHSARMRIPDPAGVNRLSSTASTSTTRASRGSPPPPETPVDMPAPALSGLSDIEARYAASGIPGDRTLNEMQARSAAATARRAQYVSPQPQRGPPLTQARQGSDSGHSGGRWSPTERPGSEPHGPPVMFQGSEEVESPGGTVLSPQQARNRQPSYPRPGQPPSDSTDHLEAGVGRLGIGDEPPPAYSPPVPGTLNSPYPNEKGLRGAQNALPVGSAANSAASGSKPAVADPNVLRHPAFANDRSQGPGASPSPQPGQPQQQQQQQQNGAPVGLTPVNIAQANQPAAAGPSGAGPASPPPLPEGWIAHLDNNSGQYYYIHLPTQSTQWEFPKGPTPLNMEPMSPGGAMSQSAITIPVGSTFKQPLTSPGFGSSGFGSPIPQMANYDKASIMSSMTSPTTAGFTGPPPSAGVDVYKVAPTNGVYFGPYLRYTNMDLERGLWLGSIMLVTDTAQPPTIHIHQSVDLSPNPRQLKAHPIHSHQRWLFYRYDVDLKMEDDHPSKWTYAITSHLGCTRYEFLIASRYETSWRFVAHSGNDFALNVSANERSKLGGVGLMWKDVLLKHQECGGFHTQIGLGGQIYADRLWKDVPALRQWTQTSGKENRKNAPWTPNMEEDVTHAYFHYYTSHLDQLGVREAFAQIPHVCCLDDHDIFDGYGSYPDYMQQSNVFKNLGRLGIEMYLLFQHHTTFEILRNVSNDIDLFTITGTGWHFVKYLGPCLVIVGPDTRSERNGQQVMAGPTYQGLFPKVAVLPPSVQHCIWLLPVPIVYPRLEAMEQIAGTVATGKKVVTGGFNMLGKVAGGVAGVVGAKGVVNQGFDGIKKAVGKSGLMQGVLNPFGDVEMLDELKDMWTHDSKDLERTYVIRTLQGISHNKSLRMTFLSGSVNACGAGLLHDPHHPSDHKTMYQLISSSIVNAPMPGYVLKLLHTNKPLYIPANGHRSSANTPSDTKEDMMEIFAADVDGRPRENRKLMGRRNYLACVAYDPEVVQGAFGNTGGRDSKGGRLSLAADFMVQGEGAFGQPMKYGPVIIPSLEYGR